MTKHLTLAALCLATAPMAAMAQDAPSSLTTEQARSIFTDLAGQAETAVAEGDWQGILDWLDRHVADDAPVTIEGSMLLSSGAAIDYDMAMRGAELTAVAGMSMGSTADLLESVRNFSLRTNVLSTWEIPGGKAGIVVSFYELGELALPEGQSGPEGETAVPFSSETTCAMRLSGSAEDFAIDMASCEARSLI